MRVRARKGGEGREKWNDRGKEGGLKECGSEGGRKERHIAFRSMWDLE